MSPARTASRSRAPKKAARSSARKSVLRRTVWLRMQSDAKRSRGRISLQFCDLQGDLQKLQGEQHPLPVNFPNNFKIFEGSSPDIRSREHFLVMQGRSREHFWYCREEHRWNCRMVAGLARAGGKQD
jgi:hypothetical protein